jgi:hypothetical protein
MSDERRIVEFERLNPLGKLVFVAGAATNLAARAIERGIDAAADIAASAEQAFREGYGDGIEDARILDEPEEDLDRRSGAPRQ